MTRLPALGPRGEGWVAGQAVLLVAIGITGVAGLGALPPTSPSAWLRLALGLALLLAGLLLGGRGLRDLGPNLTATPRPRSGAVLVGTGVYRRIRHPIYAGLVLASLGWALASGSWWSGALAALLALWLDGKARREEAWLASDLAGYRAYIARTRRFIPGLY